MPPRRKSPKSANRRTIEMLTRLLAMSMVANSFLGLSTSFAIVVPVGDLLSLRALTSAGESEKRATSDPEIRAEQSNRMKNIAN